MFSRQPTRPADFAPLAGLKCCFFRLRAGHLVHRPRLPSSAKLVLVSDLCVCAAAWTRSGRGARHDSGFFFHLRYSIRFLTHVDPLRGKFRSFLLASLQNYLSDEADRVRRLKRGGNIVIEPLDAKSAEYRYQQEPIEVLTADKIFDARWAITLLDEVMTQVGQGIRSPGKNVYI